MVCVYVGGGGVQRQAEYERRKEYVVECGRGDQWLPGSV